MKRPITIRIIALSLYIEEIMQIKNYSKFQQPTCILKSRLFKSHLNQEIGHLLKIWGITKFTMVSKRYSKVLITSLKFLFIAAKLSITTIYSIKNVLFIKK